MARSTQKARLQTYHAKDIGSLEHKGVLLSNTSKHVQKVITNILLLAFQPEKSDGYNSLAEMMVDKSMDIHANVNTGMTSYADFEHPAALCIQTRVKHYQNSVS